MVNASSPSAELRPCRMVTLREAGTGSNEQTFGVKQQAFGPRTKLAVQNDHTRAARVQVYLILISAAIVLAMALWAARSWSKPPQQ